LIVFDITVINLLAYYVLSFSNQNLYFFDASWLNNQNLLYLVYSSGFWLLSSFLLEFYKVYRHTSLVNILSLLTKQIMAFSISVFAFIGIFRSIDVNAFTTFNYILYSFSIIAFLKLLSFYALKTYRKYLNGNVRQIVIIGNSENAKELKSLFAQKKDLGYNVRAVFSDSSIDNIAGTIKDSFSFLNNHDYIDEIYCSIDELSEREVNQIVKYANNNHCNIKFIPNTKNLFAKRLKTDYYDYLPVLSIQEIELNNEFNKFIKRGFDILFSLFVIVFILSWLSIILYILIKLGSNGPLFYKHKRNGINYNEFNCYKYRTLKTKNEIKRTYVKQNDDRVTKIGKFLRKTSIDELPQFINVLKGDMSVVGPRPHMLSYTDDYAKVIDRYNFIFRHHVKPGITGLAQIKGYRGEIKTNEDIINRVKYDIFYIENWSIFLDLKIIFITLINIFKGEDKAY